MTEWYPRATVPKAMKLELPAIEWKGIKVTPRESRAAKSLGERLPREQRGSHYYAARDAAADFVTTAGKGSGPEVEKLLFYRGIGNFDAPLMVTLPSGDEGRLLLLNTSTETLRDLFLEYPGHLGPHRTIALKRARLPVVRENVEFGSR